MDVVRVFYLSWALAGKSMVGCKGMAKYYQIVILAVLGSLICTCNLAHLRAGFSGLKNNTTKRVPPPSWVVYDCTSSDGVYCFVGYGKAASNSLSAQAALISAKKSVLLCVFGDKISYSFESTETMKALDVKSKTRLSLTYEHIDWSGFEKVLEKHVVRDNGEFTEIYSQFRWPTKSITAARKDLKTLLKKIEKNRVLEKKLQHSKKSRKKLRELIRSQKEELKLLKAQKYEMERLQSNID